jgi:hypothetical protein
LALVWAWKLALVWASLSEPVLALVLGSAMAWVPASEALT